MEPEGKQLEQGAELVPRITVGLASALAAARAVFARPMYKDAEVNFQGNSGRRTQYAFLSFPELVSAASPVLHKHGLSFWHDMHVEPTGGGDVWIEATCWLVHESGGLLCSKMGSRERGRKGMSDVQAVSATVTTLKRYTLMAMLGVASSDEEANDLHESYQRNGVPEQPKRQPPKAQPPKAKAKAQAQQQEPETEAEQPEAEQPEAEHQPVTEGFSENYRTRVQQKLTERGYDFSEGGSFVEVWRNVVKTMHPRKVDDPSSKVSFNPDNWTEEERRAVESGIDVMVGQDIPF